MSYDTIRLNLSAAQFPFLSELMGRSIIVPGLDENYDRQVASTADNDKDKGIPQVYYLHNCVPTTAGYQTVGYKPLVSAVSPGATDFGPVFSLTVANFGRILFCPAAGSNYIYDRTQATAWNTLSSFTPGTISSKNYVSTAYVNGDTYICFSRYGIYRYDTTLKKLVVVTITGITASTIVSICASNGYMIAATNAGIAWSSLLSPIDFVPSLITGASGGNLNEAVGAILFILAIAGGFVIYCEGNTVSAKATSNVNFPFAFNQISGAGSASSAEQVSWQSNAADHYAWTNIGLQKINLNGAITILPEFADFIASKVYEDFNEVTTSFTQTNLTTQLNIVLTVVGLRYVVISYGVFDSSYTYAIIYDLNLKRYGKLKITHVDCFQWNYPNIYSGSSYTGLGTLRPIDFGPRTAYTDLGSVIVENDLEKDSFAFVQYDGTIVKVDFSLDTGSSPGVFLLGKYQGRRNNSIVHLDTQLETQNATDTIVAYLLPSLNGKDWLNKVPIFVRPRSINSKLVTFSMKYTALSISMLFIGSFNLTTAVLRFTMGGSR